MNSYKMTAGFQEISRVVPIAATAFDAPSKFDVTKAEFHVVTGDDVWLRVAYDMLLTEFDSSVLDPYERYVEWLGLNQREQHPFPYLMMVAFVRDGATAQILGVISGNLMRLRDDVKNDTKSPDQTWFFAIGHQITSPVLRTAGIKGVGSRLWQTSHDAARTWARSLGGVLRYSVGEAENDSLGFLTKMGCLWPQGVTYWQPPLEFDEQGMFIHPEVPEILVFLPMEGVAADTISQSLLREIIATIYLNWSLYKYRQKLTPEAMQRAEEYVMGDLFGRVCRRIPDNDPLRLVPIRLSDSETGPKIYRTIALSQGIQHGLEPTSWPSLSEINDFDDMLRAMKSMAFGARTLGQAADVLHAMASDRECKVILTLAGAVSVAKLDSIVAAMIERDLVHCIVSTGAVVCHGFNSERGHGQFQMRDGLADTWLYEQGYNRIYDTIETEYALDELEDCVASILSNHKSDSSLCSADIVDAFGGHLAATGAQGGMIEAAHRHKVPIFIPAFTDSEIGLDFAIYNHHRRKAELPEIRFDPFTDFERFCSLVRSAKTLGIVTLGGGVPRNWAQQIGPYVEAIERREHGVSVHPVRFKYAVRICPDPVHWGGLSGCTYSEGVSWGKFLPAEEGGQFAEVLSDFSLVFPFLIKGLFQRLDKSAKVQ
jgi:deoxyhypusine synthase